MAKTLRVRTKTGWVTKPIENTTENRLSAGEVDDNFLALESDIENRQKVYDSVADMKADTTLTVGRNVRTLGYYTPGDGGGNDYEIVAAATGTADGGSFIDLSGSGLQAKGLFIAGVVNVKQFGAVGDGVSDDTISIQCAMNYTETIFFPVGVFMATQLIGVRNNFIGEGSRVTSIGLVSSGDETLASINELTIEMITVDDRGRSSLDHSTSPGTYLFECTEMFIANDCSFITDRCVLSQQSTSYESKCSVLNCTLKRSSSPVANESSVMNIFTLSQTYRIDFINLLTDGVLVGRSIINATHNHLSVGLNEPAIARVTGCVFNGLRNTDEVSEVKCLFLQGYNARVVHNIFNDVFGRHIDILGNYDAGLNNDIFFKSNVSNNKIDYTATNSLIQGASNNEAGSIYCRYADAIIQGNHLDYTNLALTSNTYDSISARHGYKSVIVLGNTIINPKGSGINIDISDQINTTDINASVLHNVILNHTNNSRYGIRIVNVSSTKNFENVVIKGNSIDTTSTPIFIGCPTARSPSFTIESLSVEDNWDVKNSKICGVEFEGYPRHLHATELDVTVTANILGTSSLGVIGVLGDALGCINRYNCKALTLELDVSVDTTQTITGPVNLSPLPQKTTIKGDNGVSGRVRFYSAGGNQTNLSVTLRGNLIELDDCIFNSDSGTSTTSLLTLFGDGFCQVNNPSAQYGEHFVDSRGVDFSIKGGTIDDINLGNSGFRAIINVLSSRIVNCSIVDTSGASNTRLYHFRSPTVLVHDNISLGSTAGIKTQTIV